MTPHVDHLVYACPDLAEGVDHVEELLGVRATPGGRHEGLGTHNALVGLGHASYLEIVARDPTQPDPDRARWFGLDDLAAPRLVTWATAGHPLDQVVGAARDHGVDLGAVVSGGRARPDGSRLNWRFTDPWADRFGGVVPFFLDWLDSRHPGLDLADECELVGLSGRHPQPEHVSAALSALDVPLAVTAGEAPRLLARISGPNGVVDLS